MQRSVLTLDELQAAAVDALRAWAGTDGAERTNYLKAAASAFVDAREHFFTKEGDPDYLGRTHLYRRWVAETAGLANIPQEQSSSLFSAVRYHTGNIVRATYDAEILEAMGLLPASPKERAAETRERYSAITALFGSGGPAITTAEEITEMADLVEATLKRVSLPAVRKLTAAKRREIVSAVQALQLVLDSVLAAAQKA